MTLKIETACPCVSADCKDELERDPNEPTLVSCFRCSQISFSGDVVDPAWPNQELLPVSPGSSLGDAFFGGRLGQDRFGMKMEWKATPKGVYALFINGGACGSIFQVRRTIDGPMLLFPGSSTRWYERVIHTDDLFWLFGDNFVELEPRIARSKEGDPTVFDYMSSRLRSISAPAQADQESMTPRLRFSVKAIARVG